MDDSPTIENGEALTRVFGYWPSFHDAEVLSIRLDRDVDGGPVLDAQIHVFEMTDRVDERGYYVLTHHTLVTIRFANVHRAELAGFNDQSSLEDLGLMPVDPKENDGRGVQVFFDASHGVGGSLLCERVSILAAEPFTPAV